MKSIARFIPDGFPLPILRGPAKGGIWLAGAAPGPSKGLSVLINHSEPDQLAEASRLAQGKNCCFDVGAQAGLYSLVFARRVRKVFAFEPWPPNLSWLHRTLAWNHVSNVTVLPWAMSGHTGLSTFKSGLHSSMGKLDKDGITPVFAVSLQDFISQYGNSPDVIKLDVEGAEADLLRGGLDFLRERKPSLLLSVHDSECRRDCLEILGGLGYKSIKPLNGRDIDSADEYCAE